MFSARALDAPCINNRGPFLGIQEWIYRIQIHWEGYRRGTGMDL